MKVKSYAKVNLGLWVLGKRPDGYHEIFTIFHEIDLHDDIEISEGPPKVETFPVKIPQEENLVWKGLKLMENMIGKKLEFSVKIRKRIPLGGGLGGGSSNLAYTLKAVNELLNEPLSEGELKKLVSNISSDGPFFLLGGTAVGRGRGEILEPLEHLSLKLTLVVPKVTVSTGKVYSSLKESDFSNPPPLEDLLDSIVRGGDLLENRLGDVACRLYPQVGEVVEFLKEMGKKPLVSGTGASVFFLGEAQKELIEGATQKGWKVIKCISRPGV